ncbi:MAG TPA: AI-2E family transporter [Labilithrix sp.]|nr:AI-2E family transporter [Labilithrix sp.]
MTDPPRSPSSPALTVEEEAAEVSREEHGALKWAALAAAVAIAWLVMPIGVGILLGMLIAFVMQPLYGRLKPRFGVGWAALSVVLGATAALAGSVFALAWLFVTKGVLLARELIAIIETGGGDRILVWIGRTTEHFGITSEELTKRARRLAEDVATRTASEADTIIGALATSLLGAFFAMLTMHYILRNWETVSQRAQETFPLRPDYTRALFAEFRRVGRTTLMGTMVTGLAQGILATVGYWLAGVPEPIFFGAATAVASLVPAVGTMLVWVPAGIVLIVIGHPAAGVFELVWGGLLVVALSDYYVRPRLVGGESEMPSLVTFAALFGGVEVFGLKGLVLGPVLMSLAVAVLRLYATETRLRRHITRPSMLEKPVPSVRG